MEEKNQELDQCIGPPVSDLVITRTRRGVGKMEVLMFIFFVAKTLSDTIITNLLERSACLVIYRFNESNCTGDVNPAIEGILQQSTATILMGRSMIEAFVPCLVSLFIGPWSDTNGRRPLILLSLIGFSASSTMWCVLSLIPGLHPLFFLLPSLPVAFGGGYVTFFLAIYCYVSDTTEFQHRAFRMGLLEAACLAGVLFSLFGTPYILKISSKYGFSIVFALSAWLMMLAFLCTYFFINESVNVVESQRMKLWRLDHAKEVFKTCLKSRPNHVRTMLLLMIFNLVLSIVIFEGEMKILYMYFQKRFEWNLIDYTRFASFYLLLAGASVVGSTWLFMSKLKLPDLPVMFAGTVCMALKSLIQATATTGILFYVSAVFAIMTVLVMPLSRSQFSKLVPPDELGKLFAFSSFLEASAPLAASPLYTSLYKTTIDTIPSAVFWLSVGFSSVSVLLIGSAMALHYLAPSRDSQAVAPLLNEEEDNRGSIQT